MARFQALTNTVLDTELDLLRQRLGLEPHQKADLLREMAAIAGWVARQAASGRVIEAHGDGQPEPLLHPALERLRAGCEKPLGQRLTLNETEINRLAAILEGGFDPPPALRTALAHLGRVKRRPPVLRWPSP